MSAEKIYVTIFGEKGIYLSSTRFGSRDRHHLPAGDDAYQFYTSLVVGERWAICADKPEFGILLDRLRTLENMNILEAAKVDGKRYFR